MVLLISLTEKDFGAMYDAEKKEPGLLENLWQRVQIP